jgi:UDP-3-O-[3-hydroxymyristoyl] N-acetylglucosamine deacetylase/3-hydroxyacyl-[acyl-carrier-protein] dehydratase
LSKQRTIKEPVEVAGQGLFTSVPGKVRFCPAPAGAGVVFVRTDLPKVFRIGADIANLCSQQDRRTSLRDGTVGIDTVEHVLSAVYGLGIDNLIIELDADEAPGMDCSPKPFADALVAAGVVELEAEAQPFVIDAPITVAAGEAMLAALPGSSEYLDILFDLDYGGVKSIGRQVLGFRLGQDDYAAAIAPSRTFLLEAEAKEFQSRGWGKHLSPSDVLVMGDEGPIGNALRFPDEHVRHKIADLIGDLALLGRPLRGRVVAYKSGHALNHQLVRRLAEQLGGAERAKSMARAPKLDIRQILELLPHRYPFLMIDRVIEMIDDRKAVGIKNVTINEPFFTGHYPGLPIMPAVMTLEAMAQLSGLLLIHRLEHTGRVPYMVSMDHVRFRRPARPGDQLVIEAESLHVRSRSGHCRCKAFIGGELAAEAEVMFMLVDRDPT